MLPDGRYVVTGAASGIGRACAQVLVEAGGTPVLVDRNEAGLRETSEKLGGADACAWHVVDVCSAADVQRLAERLLDGPPVTGIVNAAGIVQLGSLTDLTEDDWDRVLEVNLKGVFLICRALIPMLVEAGGGAIVNLASVSGRTKSIYSAPNYVASKAGVIGLTMSLAAQFAAKGVRVNSVAPGLVDTAMLSGYSEEQKTAMNDAIPMGRFAHPREVATVVRFLLSDDSSYLTGQTLNVNGGQFMQ